MVSKLLFTSVLLWVVFTFSACSSGEATSSLSPVQITASYTPEITTPESIKTVTQTPFEPTETPGPMAALVNGEGILQEDYEVELAMFQSTSGTGLVTYGEDKVLEDLIDQVLLAQAASESGFIVDDAMLQTRIQEMGLGDQGLADWMTGVGYSEDSFYRGMRRSIAAAWMRDQIIADVPDIADQVHARQILLYNLDEAEIVYAQLEDGTEFGTLAAEYDPISKGDLGWFPPGYLTVPELDDILFSLEPGEYSMIIQTALGYHIVQVLERDPNHPLTANAHQVLQIQTLTQWLEVHRSQSEIVVLVP
jgi:peptidyl-prolyl cis-trans isomerase C